MKPDTERADDVEHLAFLQSREPLGAAPDAFVEKLDAAAGAVDAIDALRPPQPQFARVGRGTQEIEKLARSDSERFRRCRDDEMLVLVIDPVVRDHRAQGLLRRNIGFDQRRLALANDERRRRKDFPHCVRSRLSVRMVRECELYPGRSKIKNSSMRQPGSLTSPRLRGGRNLRALRANSG